MYETTKAQAGSIAAITAALYVLLFFLSDVITMPRFTLLYLPIILLGVFPIWFGRYGLIGCLIGAFIGGAYVEGLGFLGIVESITALIIYGINWFLIRKISWTSRSRKDLVLLIGIYSLSLFMGTGYILWQDAALRLIPVALAELVFLPTYALNLAIQSIVCPILIRTLSPRLRSLGVRPRIIAQ